MKRTAFIMAAALLLQAAAYADNLEVKSFRYAGPYTVKQPCLIDSVDVNGKKFAPENILDTHLSLDALRTASLTSVLPHCDSATLNLVGFSVETMDFVKADLKVEGTKKFQVFVDGRKDGGHKIKLEPGTHEFAVKFQGPADSLKLSFAGAGAEKLSLREDGGRIFSLDLNTQGPDCNGISLSPEGGYLVINRFETLPDGKRSTWRELVRLSDGKVLSRSNERFDWMPAKDLLRYTRRSATGLDLYSADPETGAETLLARSIPEGNFVMSPDCSYLIYTKSKEGPKEGEVHQILTPDDRQPGWRNRFYLSLYDLATGQMQDLTYGFHSTWLNDISADGRYILFQTSRERLEQRPTTLSTLYIMDMGTLEARPLFPEDGFIGSAQFSPDGKRVLVDGSPEAFGGIGRNLPEDRIPNQYDKQLFIVDIASGSVNPITKDFNPSVSAAAWSVYDGRIYFTAEDKDCVNLFRCDPEKGGIEQIPISEDHLYNFDLARTSPLLACYGQSLNNAMRVYTYDLKKKRQNVIRDISAERLEGVELGEGLPYEFTSSKGDLINCFYVLPPHFDASRKYPMIVHYYGGCSPTSRYCIGSYSPQMYAAQGYVFLAINPSGASGFGQEFASRHVNTAGDGVAEDIIEATRRFCADHPFVNTDKVGCFSASYGGFMTQLLLASTDIYATGISHAGISSHTSYWGEGYWGYSYSETSMANSYPWTRKDLYVDHSPLYFADRIHTPLLFLHGSADTNVPIGESIQMFTALKLLGQETAFVVVDGENHGISDYGKKRQWLRTIFAWFAKYLKDDPSWWDELYPEKNL